MGSVHCLGVCSGFAGALSAIQPTARPGVLATCYVLYHLGKIGSYRFLGTVAAAAGRIALDHEDDAPELAVGALVAAADGLAVRVASGAAASGGLGVWDAGRRSDSSRARTTRLRSDSAPGSAVGRPRIAYGTRLSGGVPPLASTIEPEWSLSMTNDNRWERICWHFFFSTGRIAYITI